MSPNNKRRTATFIAEIEMYIYKLEPIVNQQMGQFLILATPRPASSGDTRDGSNNRACPSPDARRSTPPSSSSPPASAPPKPPSLNPPLSRVLRSASCHRSSFNSVAIMSSGDLPHGMIGFIGQDSWSVSRSAFRAD